MALGSEAACPKCGWPRPGEAAECPRCGVIFSKFKPRLPAASPGISPETVLPPVPVSPDPLAGVARAGRAALLLGLAVWTWQFARLPMGAGVMSSVLHLPDLVFHEAGHVLFSPFGRFMTVLGGSLSQVLVPVVLGIALLRQRDAFGASVCAWWAGENLLDLAPYVADSRALQLVLLGGHTGAEVEGHDWEYLLTTLGWLQHDRALGLAFHRVGLLVMVGALAWGLWAVARGGARESPPLSWSD